MVDDYEDFYDGSWDDEVNLKDESGTTFSSTRVWTGSNNAGTELSSVGISQALGKNPARLGAPNGGGGPLSGNVLASQPNTQQHPLYALSSVFVVGDSTTLSTDATLSALTVNDGTTDHTIDLDSTPYTLDVGNAVTTVTLTATPNHTGASVSAVTLGGTAIADRDFTDGITVPSLAEGDNVIVVTVTAEDGTKETYTVTVTRAGTTATVPGAPTSLTATASGTTTINLSWTAPASDGGSAITGYKIEVSSDGGSSWTDREANTGTTTTTYSHTGLDPGTTRHYRVSAINANGTGTASNVDNATTLSTDATLSTLTVNDGTTDHTIDLATTPYTLDVGNAVTTVTLTATPTHTGASVVGVTLGGTAIADTVFTDGITVPSLAEGDNVIVVTVTAEDGSTKETYTVTVTRAGTNIAATGEPAIEGTPQVGQTGATPLSRTVGFWG